MAYIVKCVLHASSPAIWRRLVGLGYHANPFTQDLKERNAANRLCVVTESDCFFCIDEDKIKGDCYDCGTNEKLFFALSALRDDTDFGQWFIYDNRSWNASNPQYFWFVCHTDKIEDDMCENRMYVDCVKATPEEIIYQFTDSDMEM